MRLFLWTLPYICIIPGITIYYLIENIKNRTSKISLFLLSLLIVYFLFNFFSITPYHYTYLNFFNGKVENRYKKFENDYWGSSVKELIKYTNFDKNKNLMFGVCGISEKIIESHLAKKGYNNFRIVNTDYAEYIIMTNRVVTKNREIIESELTTCFDKFRGVNLFNVKRNGLLLSAIRKKIKK